MYKPKHLKKTKKRPGRWLICLGIILTFMLIWMIVPVGGDPETVIVIESTPVDPITDTLASIPPVSSPGITNLDYSTTIPNPADDPSTWDFSIPAGKLYDIETLAEWDARSCMVTNPTEFTERVQTLIYNCVELLIYECAPGETLVEALAKTVTQEIGGLTSSQAYSTTYMEEAAVVWCVLNRADAKYDNATPEQVTKILKAPKQFAYYSDKEIHPGMEELVIDVLIRWQLEKSGLLEDCGRVLPSEYLYFHGDGVHNHFRIEYDEYVYWDWSLTDPYKK